MLVQRVECRKLATIKNPIWISYFNYGNTNLPGSTLRTGYVATKTIPHGVTSQN
jgi:hypothetical protein